MGQLLRKFRQDAGISQATLAARSGVSPGYIGLLETGDRSGKLNMDMVKRLAQALGGTIDITEQLLRDAGHLRPNQSMFPSGVASPPDSIEADPRLTDQQKDMLLRLYYSYVPGTP